MEAIGQQIALRGRTVLLAAAYQKNMEISKTQPFFMRKGQIGKPTPMSFEDIKSILLAGKVELNTLDCVQNIRNGGLLP